ncbi:MAG TPA: BrnT family toxin [Chthoniobacteraceae bacterium]|nr:BrnT family toxin [Chthoniobacteraceae bacterium]
MDFDWIDVPFDLKRVTPKEIEESFEDPFGLRLLPEEVEDDSKARYFNLGKSVGDRGIFTVFWTDGKRYRAIFSRDMTPEEQSFYERKNSEAGY